MNINPSCHLIAARLCSPFAALYRAGVAVRNWCYDYSIFRNYRCGLHVICVGNAIAGGSGKSPFAEYLAAVLRQEGRHPVLLTRGYGGRYRGPHLVQSGYSPADVGDEALMHFAALQERVPVVVARDRVAGARFIAAQHLGDVIVLDDGYQHRRLARDLNILLLDASCEKAVQKWRSGRLLPEGSLREPLHAALVRADCVVYIRRVLPGADAEKTDGKELPETFTRPVFEYTLAPLNFVDVFSGETVPLSALRGKKAAALAGIASPEDFFATLRALSIELEGIFPFSDHHAFSAADWRRVSGAGSGLVLATMKDALKLHPFLERRGQLYALAQQGAFPLEAYERSFLQLVQNAVAQPSKRVMLLTSDLGGGTGNHLLQMTAHWQRSDWQAVCLTDAKLTARVKPAISVQPLRALSRWDRYPLSQCWRFWQILRVVSRERPDIVHAYFFWPIIYGRLLKLTRRIDFLVENREDQGFNWGAHEYLLLRLTRTVPDRIVCVSQAVQDTVLQKEGVAPHKTCVIYNGTAVPPVVRYDLTSLREKLGLSVQHQVVGMVANFNRSVKGVENFIDAIPLILTQCPAARFVLLGRGQQEAELKRRAEVLGVAEQLIFAGFRADIEPFYELMSVSVLSSLSEGLSITLLESMSRALPVVATRVGGNRELVVDGETGFLVPPKDSLALAEKIVVLLKDRTLAKVMGEAGLSRVSEHFQISLAAEHYLKVYDSLLS